MDIDKKMQDALALDEAGYSDDACEIYRQIINELENLKCCSNCKNIPGGDEEDGKFACSYPDDRWPSACCESWVFDGMTFEQRKI